jgi:hypothetical protein
MTYQVKNVNPIYKKQTYKKFNEINKDKYLNVLLSKQSGSSNRSTTSGSVLSGVPNTEKLMKARGRQRLWYFLLEKPSLWEEGKNTVCWSQFSLRLFQRLLSPRIVKNIYFGHSLWRNMKFTGFVDKTHQGGLKHRKKTTFTTRAPREYRTARKMPCANIQVYVEMRICKQPRHFILQA